MAYVEDFELIIDVSKRVECERKVFDFVKMVMKERRKFEVIDEVILVME